MQNYSIILNQIPYFKNINIYEISPGVFEASNNTYPRLKAFAGSYDRAYFNFKHEIVVHLMKA
jgi:hypothetical protein